MKLLFHQGTPVPPRRYLHPHVVDTAAELGWSQLENGDLLQAAEEAEYDLLITTDTNLQYQQDLTGRKIGIVVLRIASWPRLGARIDQVSEGIRQASPGDYLEI